MGRARRPNQKDRIAAEAARLLESGRVPSIEDAIGIAADLMGGAGHDLPSPGRVRRHMQALSMATLGEAEYRRGVDRLYGAAEELMTALAEMIEGATPMLVGRAARGLVDGPMRLHIRLYSESTVEHLAQVIVELGYAEPEFETVNTRFGRLNRLLLEDEGIELVLTRCPEHTRGSIGRSLYSDEPIATETLEQVRARVGEAE